jgi:hypothetical protein
LWEQREKMFRTGHLLRSLTMQSNQAVETDTHGRPRTACAPFLVMPQAAVLRLALRAAMQIERRESCKRFFGRGSIAPKLVP